MSQSIASGLEHASDATNAESAMHFQSAAFVHRSVFEIHARIPPVPAPYAESTPLITTTSPGMGSRCSTTVP